MTSNLFSPLHVLNGDRPDNIQHEMRKKCSWICFRLPYKLTDRHRILKEKAKAKKGEKGNCWSVHQRLDREVGSALLPTAGSSHTGPRERDKSLWKQHNGIMVQTLVYLACFYWYYLQGSKRRKRTGMAPLQVEWRLCLSDPLYFTNTNTHTKEG